MLHRGDEIMRVIRAHVIDRKLGPRAAHGLAIHPSHSTASQPCHKPRLE